MSDSTRRPDWRRMKPVDFGARAKANQDALFLVDEPDACGTDALDGYGFGAVLWADQVASPTGVAEYPHRAVEPDGTVHAARYAGDRQHFTTKCAAYPAPTLDDLEHGSDRKVTCHDCQ